MAAKSNKGQIGVTTENIFPVIKQFLYSDHEIFLRELVANAVDASQKMKAIASNGDFKGELGELKVRVELDEKAKTLRIIDSGIGMTDEEIDRYINQIAFSSAGEFLQKYKDQNIIGHFGLGFYSAFMVAKKVTIESLSWKEGSSGVIWTCEGNPEFEMGPCDKAERGTVITLYLDDEAAKDYGTKGKIQQLLDKYCKFMPVPVVFGKEQEWKDGKYVDTDKDNVINKIEPLWTRKPSELKEEDYMKFYRDLYPMKEDPLFYIHLNVDYPFNLTGILYFPRIKSNIELQRNKIQLYCNQVFVTDHVEGIVPEFLTLLHGVIDSPDIPLNVSRSYLQSDANVKKISTYITKKVADRLSSIFKENRKEYEEKWDDLKLFINYGMLSERDAFYDRAKDFALMKDTEGKYFTFDEYRTLIKDNQTDKDGNLIYLYAVNKEEQYTYIEAAKAKGYSVLLCDGELDVPTVSLLEQKLEKSHFVRVDSDTVDRLIAKDEVHELTLSQDERDNLSEAFRSQMPRIDKTEFGVEVQALGETAQPTVITQNEWMRRMKDMSRFQQGMGFYGQMPDSYMLVLNADHPLIKQILADETAATAETMKPVLSEIKGQEARLAALRQAQKDKKPEEISQADKDDLSQTEKALEDQRGKKRQIVADYAKDNTLIHQLVDLALLQNGMLKGAALNDFVKRSVEVLK